MTYMTYIYIGVKLEKRGSRVHRSTRQGSRRGMTRQPAHWTKILTAGVPNAIVTDHSNNGVAVVDGAHTATSRTTEERAGLSSIGGGGRGRGEVINPAKEHDHDLIDMMDDIVLNSLQKSATSHTDVKRAAATGGSGQMKTRCRSFRW